VAARRGSAAALRRTVSWLDLVGFALGLWALFWPHPHLLLVAVLIIAPFVAMWIAWTSNGAISLNERKGSKRPQLFGLMFMPWIGLGLVALRAYDVIDWRVPIFVAIAIGGLLTYIAMRIEADFHNPVFVVLLPVFASFWGWGLAVEANGMFDRKPQREISTPVLRKSVSHGKGTSYYLNVGRTQVPEIAGDISVDRSLYRATELGQPFCISLYGGSLGWRWYRAHACS
jgi:hypothetical protein